MIFMTNARNIFYRGRAGNRDDPQKPGTLGSESQTTTKSEWPPRALEYHIDYTDSQVPVSENYLYVDPQYREVYTG